MIEKFLNYFLPKKEVFVYREFESEEEYFRELHWFNFRRIRPYSTSDREKRVIVALAKRTGNPSMVDFKYKEVCA